MRILCGTILAAGVASAALGSSSAETSRGVVLQGRVGEKGSEVFESRLVGDKAKGDIYGEAVNAFVTRMDDLHPYPEGATNHYGWWQGEYWGKTMLCLCAFARYSGRDDVKSLAHDRALEFVRRFQRKDGYLSSYDDEDHVFGFNWNVWSRKYTSWALVEAYDLTGDAELLDAAAKIVDHLAAQLKRLGVPLAGTGYFSGIPSLSILKPVVLLAERTGEQRFLDFARDIVADNDRADGRIPNIVANAFGDKPVHEWYPKPEEWAKAYELMSVVEGLVEFSKATGESRPLEAAERIWEKVKSAELNAVGSVGYHDHFTGAALQPNCITEVCDVIHWMRLCRYLNEATGDAKYLDAWEVAFLNAFLAGVYRGGEWGAHDVRSHGRRHLTGMYEVEMTYHFCCIDNAPRAFCDWADRQVVAAADGRLDVNFYTDCAFAGEGCSVEVSGNYPVGDVVRVVFRSESPRKVRLRVPGWSVGGMTVDGAAAAHAAGYVEMSIGAGERVFVLGFDMSPRVERSSALAVKVGESKKAMEDFRMTWSNPEMAGFARTSPGVRITRGPLVLAKARSAGCDDHVCFTDVEGLDASWHVSLAPVRNESVWGAWKMTLESPDGKTRCSLGVCDYASAADYDNPRNSFSIWF